MKSQLRASWNCNSKERGKKWPPNLSQEADNFGSIYEFGINKPLLRRTLEPHAPIDTAFDEHWVGETGERHRILLETGEGGAVSGPQCGVVGVKFQRRRGQKRFWPCGRLRKGQSGGREGSAPSQERTPGRMIRSPTFSPNVTARTKAQISQVDDIKIRFVPASIYCHTAGYNLAFLFSPSR
jgi:hypothetical protein